MTYNNHMRILFAIKETIDKISKDNLTGFSAQTSYYLILAFFPFVLLLLSLIRFLPVDYETFIRLLNDFVPEYFRQDAISMFDDMYQSSSAALTGISAVGTLWASGKGFMSIRKGLNTIYGIEERRNFLITRCIASLQTLIFMAAIIMMLALVVFSKGLTAFTARYFPLITAVLSGLLLKRAIILPLFLALIFMFMYNLIPSRRSSLISQFPGSLLAGYGWFLFSMIFSLYVAHTSYTSMFGSLGTLILVLLWIYSCMLIIFFGAEINVLIGKGVISLQVLMRHGKK